MERVPTKQECCQLMRAHRMLPNIISHSKQVMKIALKLVDNLADGCHINRALVIAGALLHDITKTRSLETGERHDVTGAELLRNIGYPQVAYIVEQHVFFTNFNAEGPLEEREIVYYADKCVMHDKVVSVHQRVDDLLKRYGTTEERRQMILNNKALILAIEKKISRYLRDDIHHIVGVYIDDGKNK
ncbi:MAG: HDIG domain-containing protein [Spirochaetes bacterium]|nr:HDIG domain-containing protein [Spirochaetota bacterium]